MLRYEFGKKKDQIHNTAKLKTLGCGADFYRSKPAESNRNLFYAFIINCIQFIPEEYDQTILTFSKF